ncbi:MAG: TylF/MycF/NovP-related O-methyltransferase [Rhodospirillales bacterium]|jgi:O-methyltransferase
MTEFEADWHIQEVLNEVAKGVIKSYLRGIKGDVAEFGTMTGRSATTLAGSISGSENVYARKLPSLGITPRNLHLFDSFEGLPETTEEADLKSPMVASGAWAPGRCFGINPEQLRDSCAQYLSTDRIHIYEGWFKDTIPVLSDSTKLAFVHIDCDLYSSTRDVLDGLLNRALISEGALLYFDDWDCNASSLGLGERHAWSEAAETYGIKYSNSNSYGATGHAIIVHNYTGMARNA